MWAIMRSSPRVCVPANEVSDLIFLLGACRYILVFLADLSEIYS
ncbi:hypothetical protein ALT761_00550 [Alteromonas sp. 76-1]|nr:hypothetical protein ALT761_00550 [Alteromonas sp. 76-1]